MTDPARRERPTRPDAHRPDERDPHATPLGRGANPGPGAEIGPLQASDAGTAAPRGPNVPGETGGPEGLATRENEDGVPRARRDAREPA